MQGRVRNSRAVKTMATKHRVISTGAAIALHRRVSNSPSVKKTEDIEVTRVWHMMQRTGTHTL